MNLQQAAARWEVTEKSAGKLCCYSIDDIFRLNLIRTGPMINSDPVNDSSSPSSSVYCLTKEFRVE